LRVGNAVMMDPACTMTAFYPRRRCMLNHRRRKEIGRDIDAWWSSLWLWLLAFMSS